MTEREIKEREEIDTQLMALVEAMASLGTRLERCLRCDIENDTIRSAWHDIAQAEGIIGEVYRTWRVVLPDEVIKG